MALEYPSFSQSQGGDETTYSPGKTTHAILGSKRGTQNTKRLETDAEGNLYVNDVSTLSVGILAVSSVTGVLASTLTTVVTYTAASDMKATRITCSGQTYAKVQLVLNTATIETKRMGPDRNIEFVFDHPLSLPSGSILEVKVTHFVPGESADYEASIYGA